MFSTNYNAGRPLRPYQVDREEIKSPLSCSLGRISMKSAIRPVKNYHHYKLRDFETCQRMCSASWRDVSRTFKRCNRARIDGKVLEAHLEGVAKVRPPDCRKDQEAVASYRLLGHILQGCQFRPRVAAEEVQEKVQMVP